MNNKLTKEEVTIRTEIKPGDLGFVIHRHGSMYAEEYNHGVSFEVYVAQGISEFYQNYDSKKDRVWICEHNRKIIGSLFLQHRENNTAQLRYFYLENEYRGLGLGKLLMNHFMEHYKQCGYSSSYLWTTDELNVAASIYNKHGYKLVKEEKTKLFGKELVERMYQLN